MRPALAFGLNYQGDSISKGMSLFASQSKHVCSCLFPASETKAAGGAAVYFDQTPARRIFFNFGFFKNLIYIFGPPFQNFTEMDPCRPVAGRQGVFCKICTARNMEMLRRGPPESLSPGHWATG